MLYININYYIILDIKNSVKDKNSEKTNKF